METGQPSYLPKYYVIKEQILALVEGTAPGTVIPTERTLAVQYSTSRTTVRRAVGELVAEGRLERTQGRGTFVAQPRDIHVLPLASLFEDIATADLNITTKLVDARVVPADASAAERLRVQLGAETYQTQRIRLINGEPLAHETVQLVGPLPGLTQYLATAGSLYPVLRDGYGIRVTEVEDMLEAKLAGPDEVRLLDVEMGAPMLVVHRLGMDPEGSRVEWTRTVFRGERFRLWTRLRLGSQ